MSVTKGQRIRAQDVPGLAKANTFSSTNTFNGDVYANTPATNDNSKKIATTAYVNNKHKVVSALPASPESTFQSK